MESDSPKARGGDTAVQPDLVHGGRLRRRNGGIGVLMLATLTVMLLSLFLPWEYVGGSGRSLSEYAAPELAVIAWALLAVGLAAAIVAVLSFFFGGKRSLLAIVLGAIVYLAGAGVWYVSSILPSFVASGCNLNGGPLCNLPAASPTVSGAGIGWGFVLAILSSLVLAVSAMVTYRLRPPAVAPQSNL